MKLQTITDFEYLENHRQQWDRVARTFPFYRWAWMGSWFRAFGDTCQPIVLVGQGEDDDWQAIAPFFVQRTHSGTKLQFWGSGTACTDYAGLITRPDQYRPFALAVADWLAEQTKSGGELAHVDLVELEGHTDDPKSQFFQQAMEAVGFSVHSTELEGCWVVDLPADWPELNRRLSKSMRRKTKKAVQRLNDDSTVVLTNLETSLDDLWPKFVDLHQQRRESLGELGCFADARFEQFLREATWQLIDEERGTLKVIEKDGIPLASMLLFNDVHTNYMYQSGADVARMNEEPGYQIALAAIQCSIDSGFEFFDFLRGDEPYKSRWDARRVPLYRTRFIPRKLSSIVRHNLWVTGRAIKHYFAPRAINH